MEPFQDEPVRIVVTAGGIPQPAMRDKAAFRHALLTDDEKACVCHDIIWIGVEVAFHAVYLDTLADIARKPGRSAPLRELSPLRTVHESFLSYGSSNSKFLL